MKNIVGLARLSMHIFSSRMSGVLAVFASAKHAPVMMASFVD